MNGLADQLGAGITHTYGSGQILRYCSVLIVLVISIIVTSCITNNHRRAIMSQFEIRLLEEKIFFSIFFIL